MTPFWIVNFLEKGSVEPFFETYWKAWLQNNQDASDSDRFFYITDATDPSLTKERLQEIASQELSRDANGKQKLIPAFKKNNGNEINVIFLGDITQKNTIERLHTWAAYLMQQKMPGIGSPWYSISRVTIYAILIRPDSTTVIDSTLTKEVKGFLNELASLEQMDVNHRPFEHILFLQSPEGNDKRSAAEESMCLASYHIARTNGKCFEQSSDFRYHDANATAVFYEADVQKELDAYSLSQLMLNDFVANEGPEFLNIKEAEKFVDDCSDFTDSLTPKSISRSLVSGCKSPDAVRIKRPCHPLNIFRIGKVWREYYGQYIVDMKRQLVNKMRRNLLTFQEDYKKELALHQADFIKQSTNALQEYVFQMFCDTGSHDRFRHIGLPQSLKVLEIFERRIRDNFGDDSGKAKSFIIPDDLLQAAEKADTNHWDSGHVLDVLTDRLQSLPVYNIARLLRILVLGTMAGGLLSFLHPLGWLAIPLVLIIDLLVFNAKVKRIEALKNQFVGIKLVEMRNLMDKHLNLLIEKTKNEMAQYINWLRENKLMWLQSSLSTLSAPSFQFRVSEVFQPLVSSSSTESEKPQLLIPARSFKAETYTESASHSGSFGNNPLTNNVPTAHIQSNTGGTCSIYDLMTGRKDTVQYLVQQLMHQHLAVAGGAEEDVDFSVHQSSTQSLLLLLDVSGSMSGQAIDELKQYVNELTAKGEVEWIAFSDDVCYTSRESSADKLHTVGGTNYIPAISRAAEWIRSGAYYDSIIIISDGMPFESIDDIIKAAQALNQPLNTISIGQAAENVLVDIAIQTGGEEVTIDTFNDLSEKWENDILPRMAAIDSGEYSFGNLLKKGLIVHAAKALHDFAIKQLAISNISLPELIYKYGNDKGLKEWLERSQQRNTLDQGATLHSENCNCSTAPNNDKDHLEQKLHSIGISQLTLSEEEPDMIASLLTEQPLDKIGDLQWAQALDAKDQSLNRPSIINQTLQQLQLKPINVYNNTITI